MIMVETVVTRDVIDELVEAARRGVIISDYPVSQAVLDALTDVVLSAHPNKALVDNVYKAFENGSANVEGVLFKEWSEDAHPRDENGRFSEAGEGGHRLASIFSDLKEMGIPENLNNGEKRELLLMQRPAIRDNLVKKYTAQGMSTLDAAKQANSDMDHAKCILEQEHKRDVYEDELAQLSGSGKERAEEIMSVATDKVASIMKDGVATIAFEPGTLYSILESGKFGTAFSGGFTKDDNYMNKRENMENALLNLPSTTAREDRPVYGFITTTATGYQDAPSSIDLKSYSDYAWHEVTDVSNSYTEAYGLYRATLKDDTRDRTTITLGDTFNGLVAQPITDKPDPQTLTHMGLYDSVVSTNQIYHPNYVEAQVHGGVSLNDVETLYVPEGEVTSVAGQVAAKGYDFKVEALP